MTAESFFELHKPFRHHNVLFCQEKLLGSTFVRTLVLFLKYQPNYCSCSYRHYSLQRYSSFTTTDHQCSVKSIYLYIMTFIQLFCTHTDLYIHTVILLSGRLVTACSVENELFHKTHHSTQMNPFGGICIQNISQR